MKLNLGNKGVTKTKIDAVKKRVLQSSETKIKSCVKENLDEDKKENLPSSKSYPFDVETCTPKDASKQDYFEHENVEFEANEIYRKMILTNGEFSPSMRKLMPSLRLSSLQSERPSIYQKYEIPNDPLKEALKALENTCLSYKRVNRKENKLPSSPYRDRDSIYTPCGDPNQEFLKRLEDFKLKQLQKTASRSTKKVTFNPNIQECTPKNICDIQLIPFKNTENRLVQINEKSEENTPNSPHNENEKFKSSDVDSKHEHNNTSNQTIKMDKEIREAKVDDKDKSHIMNKMINSADQNDPTSKSNSRVIPDKSVHQNRVTSVQNLKEISCQNSPVFVNDYKKVENYTKCHETRNMQVFEQKKCKESAKIYTPKPILLTSKSKMNQSYSPEFLVNRKSTVIANLAPICTPLVLKSQAKNIMFSPEADEGPIPLKLDFTEQEKDTPRKEVSKNHTLAALDSIVTTQKKLDELADQECYLSLLMENFPVICGRYLTNPVAMTLNEGDDMHFIPIHL